MHFNKINAQHRDIEFFITKAFRHEWTFLSHLHMLSCTSASAFQISSLLPHLNSSLHISKYKRVDV